MACAGLLTVCLVRQPAPQPPRSPTPATGSAGHALFQDVFRRADKNAAPVLSPTARPPPSSESHSTWLGGCEML
ncbi:N-terminal EF-hand calcium-binding protein 3 [Myotis davidii]|uniref:N-terminal EF-hand calcium-binding protein 3 n=1 Tax=Myotis davidii TaxID=225400 RepID=L5LU89_MYODS|nr:N-terminal EF-hand calcium-binding protein 3 [Myotis davidii]